MLTYFAFPRTEFIFNARMLLVFSCANVQSHHEGPFLSSHILFDNPKLRLELFIVRLV